MPQTLKRNAVIVFGLAIFFWWSFMFAKHDPRLRSIIPFGDDPYDAVGSFGTIVGVLIALLSLVRAFRPYRKQPPNNAQRRYLVRSQEAVAIAVLLTLLADTVAMARHPSLWVAAASRDELIELLGGMSVVALGVQWLIRKSQERVAHTHSTLLVRAVFTTLVATCALAVYPEQLIQSAGTHLLTVIIAAFVLFAPMRALIISLVPFNRKEGLAEAVPKGGSGISRWQRWGIVVVIGVSIGAFAFVGEMSEGANPMSLIRVLFVASVFVGLGVAGLVIAYAFLGTPLGLGVSVNEHR
jgi:hypothetical protein